MIAITLIGFAGWYVWDRNIKDGDSVSEKTEAVQEQDATKVGLDEDKISWIPYDAQSHGFSFKYPSNWGEVNETITGDYSGDCSVSCGKVLNISFSNPDAAIEIKGRTIDFHVGKDSSDLNLAQKGYLITDNKTIEAYGYTGIINRGDTPETQVINGEVKTNANGHEYVLQVTDLSDNQFVEQKYDVSNVHSALFNLSNNESGISGLAVSLGVTPENGGIFESWIDTFTFY